MGKKIANLSKPIILKEGSWDSKDLEDFKKDYPIWRITDIYQRQLVELFEILHPDLKNKEGYQEKQAEFIAKKLSDRNGSGGDWVYFPWSGCLVHSVAEEELIALKTNRNRNLITADEQEKLYGSCVGLVGLSIGSSTAIGLIHQSIAKTLKLAEFDILETTNLNRVRSGIENIGLPKIDIAARQIYEINPYSDLHLYEKGLTEEVLLDFVHKDPKPQIIFEAIDDFVMKIRLRVEARKAGIPVVMFSNLGDSILVDIERFDLDRNLPLFNGATGDLPEEILDKPEEDRNKYAVKIVGIENIPQRAIESVSEIGKTLVGRPQLSTTVAIGSAFGVYLTRRFLLEGVLPNGRTLIKFDEFLK